MSQLLQGTARGISGGIAAVAGVAAADFVHNGIPYDISAGTNIAVDSVGAIAFYHQGLPFTAASRLAVENGGVVDHISPGGAPFTAAGRLAIAPAVVDHYSAGVAYNADNNLSFSDAIVFGPDLITNGAFTFGMVGWTEQVAQVSVDNFQLRCQGSLALGYQEIVTEAAAVYRVVADQIVGSNSDENTIFASTQVLPIGEIGSNIVSQTTNQATWLFTATGIATFILCQQSAISPGGPTCLFDNITVRKTTETP